MCFPLMQSVSNLIIQVFGNWVSILITIGPLVWYCSNSSTLSFDGSEPFIDDQRFAKPVQLVLNLEHELTWLGQ